MGIFMVRRVRGSAVAAHVGLASARWRVGGTRRRGHASAAGTAGARHRCRSWRADQASGRRGCPRARRRATSGSGSTPSGAVPRPAGDGRRAGRAVDAVATPAVPRRREPAVLDFRAAAADAARAAFGAGRGGSRVAAGRGAAGGRARIAALGAQHGHVVATTCFPPATAGGLGGTR